MKYDDGHGTIINTENKPISLEDQITSGQDMLRDMKRKVSMMPRSHERQHMQVEIDVMTANIKRLIMKFERAQAPTPAGTDKKES